MEYADCYICDFGPLGQAVFLVLLVLATFLGVRRRAWTFVAALAALPLLEWYTEGLESGVAAMLAVLIGTLVAATRNRKGRSADSGLTSA
jgi:hypothetical protein